MQLKLQGNKGNECKRTVKCHILFLFQYIQYIVWCIVHKNRVLETRKNTKYSTFSFHYPLPLSSSTINWVPSTH